jgi:DNA-binding NtrC family response regulator
MKALILIIGDDPVLMQTRAELLRDWQITTVSSRDAREALRSRNYNLVILSQTVQETQARSLIAQAQELDSNPRILAIRSGDDRQLGSPTYQVDLNNPGGLRSAVARILEHETTPLHVEQAGLNYIKARAIPSSTTSK